MPLSISQQLQALGGAGLAGEMRRQLFAATGNSRRLQELGMTPLLANLLAAGITANSLDLRKATELGLDSVIAKTIWRMIVGARNTVLPAVTGTAQVGQVLTTTNGTWLNSPTLTRQWFAGGQPIAGATGTTYTVLAGDVGKTINVVVTGISTNGTQTATSNSVGPVIA